MNKTQLIRERDKMATKIDGWKRDKDSALILRSSVESNVNSMELGTFRIPCELIDDLIVEMKKHAGSEGDNESFVVGGYGAKSALGERS